MSTLFTINFRREAYQRAVARARQRVLALGVWLAYFGVLVILVGLYGLNAVALSRQLHQIERQTARARQVQGAAGNWKMTEAERMQVESYVQNPREWHDRLSRLSAILPSNVKVTSIALNPQNLSGTGDDNKLVITGQLLPAPNEDRMQGVMRTLGVVRGDSVLKRSYENVRLASTKIVEGPGGAAEFVIECR